MHFFFLAPLLLVQLLFLTFGSQRAAAEPSTLPLLQLEDFEYEGAFRLPASEFGSSSLNYSEGPIAYNALTHALFIVGHSHHQALAEFAIPEIVKSSDLSALNFSPTPLQNFSTLLSRAPSGNTQNINRIGGLSIIEHSGTRELLVNVYEYYDASGDNTHTNLALASPQNLSGSAVRGYFSMNARAHAAGWISEVPQEWQNSLGARYISGSSSGIPIISRTSVGPSAFAFNAEAFAGEATGVTTTALLDFSLANPLHEDLGNTSRSNDLWTHLSRATYGFIAPGTRTYVTLGYSGGHSSGVCYKCEQSDGNVCGGYCAPDVSDYYRYYWLWDVNELLEVKQGLRESHSVRPYAYGEFAGPFSSNEIGGGAFDAESGRLYLTAQRADRAQGQYSNPPVVLVYSLGVGTSPPVPGLRTPGDLDGDGKTDFAVIRADTTASWYLRQSSDATVKTFKWGLRAFDHFLDLDTDADLRSDPSAVRVAHTSYAWFTLLSANFSNQLNYWGLSSDIPLATDFDGDAKSDITIFRPSDGSWWSAKSGGGYLIEQWGLTGDLPLSGDYDGDRKSDLAIWRPQFGMWAVSLSSKQYSHELSDIIWKQWGLHGDHPMSGDYDGDGTSDLVVWRPASGVWFICGSSSDYTCPAKARAEQFGLPGDIPIRADFDGDGILDLSVWRPSNGNWYWKQSSDGSVQQFQWGLPGDLPFGHSVKTQVEGN